MQKRYLPSFFLTSTTGAGHGLLDGSITPLSSMSSKCLSISFVRWVCTLLVGILTGRVVPVSILCLMISVRLKSLSDLANRLVYSYKRVCASLFCFRVKWLAVFFSISTRSGLSFLLYSVMSSSDDSTTLTSLSCPITVPG